MTLKFKQKRVYGHILFYPLCDISKLLCTVCNRRCLKQKDLDVITDMGHNVEINQDVVK